MKCLKVLEGADFFEEVPELLTVLLDELERGLGVSRGCHGLLLVFLSSDIRFYTSLMPPSMTEEGYSDPQRSEATWSLI